MSALPVEVRFEASEEFRTLLRFYRRGESPVRPVEAPEPAAAPPLPASPEPAPVDSNPAPSPEVQPWPGFETLRLRRFGQGPYIFRGALAKRVSTADGSTRALWHELSLYLAEHGAGLVLHIRSEPRAGCEGWVRPIAMVHALHSAEDGWAALRAFDPAHGVPAGGCGLPAAECGSFLERIAAARMDYLIALAGFCGLQHPIVQELSERFGAVLNGEAA